MGKEEALERLTPLVTTSCGGWRKATCGGSARGRTLQPTALIHEAYLRLVGQNMPEIKSRSHFFGVAAQLMRQVLVDHARAKLASK